MTKTFLFSCKGVTPLCPYPEIPSHCVSSLEVFFLGSRPEVSWLFMERATWSASHLLSSTKELKHPQTSCTWTGPPAADSSFPMPRTLFLQHSQTSLGCLTGASAHVPDPVPDLQCLNIWHRLKHTGTQSLVSCTSIRLYTTLVCLFTAFLVMLPREVIHSAEACLHFHVVLLESKHLFTHHLACASVMLF